MGTVRTSTRLPRHLHIYFALLIPATLLAFGRFYFAGVTASGKPVTVLIHVHAASMTLWLLMLVLQAWFVRTRRFRHHRRLGRSSYVIAPLVILTTLLAVQDEPDIDAQDARVKVFGLGTTLAFAITWGLAILYRRNTPMHVRFIVSTTFAIGSAIVFRLLGNWFSWVPGLDGLDGRVAANGLILMLPLIALIVADWRSGLRRSPYWVVTLILGIIHLGFFTFAKTDGWFSFIQWFTAS